jgi:hypothetical protein
VEEIIILLEIEDIADAKLIKLKLALVSLLKNSHLTIGIELVAQLGFRFFFYDLTTSGFDYVKFL